MIIKLYRQDLRDFMNNNEIKILAGEKVDFPQQPEFNDLEIIYQINNENSSYINYINTFKCQKQREVKIKY
jgi:hypothetical protein